MRKVIVHEFITLDGVIQDPDDAGRGFEHGGWFWPYAGDITGGPIDTRFDLLLGRKTFEIWGSFWPKHADMWPGVNPATKYVASNTMTAHEWQPSVFLSGDIAEKVRGLKQTQGPDLHVYGSANLLQTLMRHDLIDEFRLMIFPITLGDGKRLFAEGTIAAAFKVTESEVSPKGIITVNYERAGAVETGNPK